MSSGKSHDARSAVAKGVWSVFLAKTGQVIELVTTPAYTWMFGLATYGLYSVLWSMVNVLEKITELAMTNSLQRVLPGQTDEESKAAVIKGALLLGIIPGILVALILSLAAPVVAPYFNVADQDSQQLEMSIRLFIWALPLWGAVEITTSALRACKAFGPEIRLRLFWEQIMRLVLSVIFWLADTGTLAILYAHLCSLTLTVFLSFRVLHKYCHLGLIWRSRLTSTILHDLFLSGLSVLPVNISGRIFSDMPVIILNFLLPGAAGADAAGMYNIARKIASIPQLVGVVFTHVVAPIAASTENRDETTIQALYAFSLRVSLLLALPTTAALIVSVDSMLSLFVTGVAAAWPIVVILTVARGFEAAVGPATAIQQVISHRGMPLLNTIIGLIIATVVTLATYAFFNTLSIAIGVAIAQIVMAIMAVWQLSRMEKIHVLDNSFVRALITALAVSLILLLVGKLLTSLPATLQGVVILPVYLLSLWTGLRYALPEHDRLALGKLGKRLRLVS